MFNDRPMVPPTVKLLAAMRALPTHTLVSVLMFGLENRQEMTAEELDDLGNQISRLAWDRQRNANHG